MMKYLCLTLLFCALVNLVTAIYIPTNKNFHLQDADNVEAISLMTNVDTEDSTKRIIQCGDEDDILTIDYIRLNPDPPVKGKNLHIDFKGSLKETVEDGAYINIVVKYGLVQLLKKSFDLCEEIQKIDKACPLKKGPIEISRDVELPKAIPGGKYTVEAHVYTVNDDPITCLHGETSFPRI
ncbi:ML domain-containing protein [Chlamydoabsidia padenii]|nr:ML domain-containing protein [Chlamydoabsidia padenii]